MKPWWCQKTMNADHVLIIMFLLSILLLLGLAVLILSVPTSLATF